MNWAIAVISAALLLAGCGADDEPEPTRLEQAMATVPGGDPVGSGYAWVDLQRLREGGAPLAADLRWARRALGPDARDLARRSRELVRLGLDPLEADAVFAVTSNYAFSARFDGIDPAGIERTLRASGAREGERGRG